MSPKAPLRMSAAKAFITLSDLYIAYRKAKVEAFYESTQPSAIQFAQYEKKLPERLDRLYERLQKGKWSEDTKFLGTYRYIPKSVEGSSSEAANQEVHFQSCDAIEDWKRQFKENKTPFKASFRLVINPTVDFQIISALWILKVGHRFDAQLDPEHSFGNRLRRHGLSKNANPTPGEINPDAHGLFAPYFSAYRAWRHNGLQAMREELERGSSILAVTMDIQQFYHRVDRRFLPTFLRSLGLSLSENEHEFTANVLAAMRTWAVDTPEHSENPEIGLPVGLSASKVIANVLLREFDRAVRDDLSPSTTEGMLTIFSLS